MSPTNLGDLLLTQAAPTGLCQIKRGASNSAATVNNQTPSGTLLGAGDGGPMRIAITPARAGWWVIRAEAIWLVVEAAWAYFTWYIQLIPTDANGFAADHCHCCSHQALGWQEYCINAAYRLNAGVAYEATLRWGYSQGYNQQLYLGPDYYYIFGEFIEDGSL